MTSIVYYTVQGDRDDPDHPNAFAISKPYDRILVGDVRDAFPLSGTFQYVRAHPIALPACLRRAEQC
jgi:hypothetical protein